MSGLFWRGTPAQVLEAWRDGRFELVISPEVHAEYDMTTRTWAFKAMLSVTALCAAGYSDCGGSHRACTMMACLDSLDITILFTVTVE
ncbi:MAG: hypothetical protein HY903_23595 [Deltaproteobacteria bacterium]|nr:hypothetical protein [Deltaproteobacteria bacterium]